MSMLAFVVTSRMAVADSGGEVPAGPFRWQECAGKLARAAKRSPLEIEKLLAALAAGSVSTSHDFMTLVVTVIAAESNFVPHAKAATSGAVGLMQVTDIGAREAERQCPFLIREYRNRRILTDPTTNIAYGSCLLRYYMSQVNNNILLALVLYNGGYRQLTRLATNATLTTETREYVLRVHHYLRRCQ